MMAFLGGKCFQHLLCLSHFNKQQITRSYSKKAKTKPLKFIHLYYKNKKIVLHLHPAKYRETDFCDSTNDYYNNYFSLGS